MASLVIFYKFPKNSRALKKDFDIFVPSMKKIYSIMLYIYCTSFNIVIIAFITIILSHEVEWKE